MWRDSTEKVTTSAAQDGYSAVCSGQFALFIWAVRRHRPSDKELINCSDQEQNTEFENVWPYESCFATCMGTHTEPVMNRFL